MSVPPDLLHVIHKWVEKADHDFKNAEHTLMLKEDCPFNKRGRSHATLPLMRSGSRGILRR